ncbi:hypothetical protein BC832DRAFT_589208 [Gaertneriomyces semiglobifer]|nr:hypothetical protein BC832DRAFT_589208 [Gaertneriomyces semiglobifer]
MRPDAHKEKATRRWKAKNGITASSHAPKGAGAPASAAGTASKSEPEASPVSQPNTAQPDESTEKPKSQFSRRKIESNAYRYYEPSPEEVLAEDAGIDKETEELRALIKEADEAYDPKLYFRFKEEREWDNVMDESMSKADERDRMLLQLDFATLEASLRQLPLHERLGIDERELYLLGRKDQPNEPTRLQAPSQSSKPEVPMVPQSQPTASARASSLNSQFASHVPADVKPWSTTPALPVSHSNSGSATPSMDNPSIADTKSTQRQNLDHDDLDFLLSLDTESVTTATSAGLHGKEVLAEPVPPQSSLQPRGNARSTPPVSEANEDLKWLDDVLG